MDTVSKTALHRLRVLNFWAAHDLSAAMDAFAASYRSTLYGLYGWKKAYRDARGTQYSSFEQSKLCAAEST